MPEMNEIPEAAAQRYIDTNQVPTDIGYDWKPFLTAIFERVCLGFQPPALNRRQFEVFVPEWTKPDFMEDSELTYPDWIYVARPKRDALRRLRPALLPRDKFREPTDYAKRWGMHPDRADGRSQLSPTSAPSRRISVALQVQLNHEHADTKALLTQETEFEGLNPVLEVDDQAKIAIKVYEDWKAKSGGTSIEQMKDTAALHVDPSTIDMEKLDTRDQEFYKCLQDEVQKDETWQRLLFKGLTTDELISNDIYNMTNNSRNKLDMGRELHYLFKRQMWETTALSGRSKDNPRYYYTTWEQVGRQHRREWSALDNDDVWQALQPALQFASRVLDLNPPIWEAIKDLRTRQPIDTDLDPRKGNSATKYLYRMVPVTDVDTAKFPQSVSDLRRFTRNRSIYLPKRVDQILRNGLRFNIVDGNYDAKRKNHIGGRRFSPSQDQGCYGFTEKSASPPGVFNIHISAQLIWPLLVPEYSESEKLCSHFMIAVTLLHELMHATHYAVAYMCGVLGDREYPNIDQEQRLYRLLGKVGTEVFDMSHANGEPYWKNDTWAELGHAFEYETFGMSIGVLPATNLASKMIALQPLMLEGYSYPTVFCDYDCFLNLDLPIVDFSQPIRIGWIQPKFDQEFWDEDIPTFDIDAIRMLQPRTTYLTLMDHNFGNQALFRQLFGNDDFSFFETVWALLEQTGMNITASYLKQKVWETRRFVLIQLRWAAEYEQIQELNSYGLPLNPLPEAIVNLETAFWAGNTIIVHSSNPDADEGQNNWYNDMAGERVKYRVEGPITWRARMNRLYQEYFGTSGRIMALVANLQGIYIRELGKYQRYIYEYFSTSSVERGILWPDDGSDTQLDWLQRTLMTYAVSAQQICGLLTALSENDFLEELEVSEWAGNWYPIFGDFGHTARILHGTLMRDHADKIIDPEVASFLATINVPSSANIKEVQRLEPLARNEYNRADVRICATLDEFGKRLEKFRGNYYTEVNPLASETQSPSPQIVVPDLSAITDVYTTPRRRKKLKLSYGTPTTPSKIGAPLGSTVQRLLHSSARSTPRKLTERSRMGISSYAARIDQYRRERAAWNRKRASANALVHFGH